MNRYFAGFSMRTWRYLDARLTNSDSKTRFGKYIKFYYEVQNMKTRFENIIVVYGVTGVDRR
jgi:hypothetical protein